MNKKNPTQTKKQNKKTNTKKTQYCFVFTELLKDPDPDCTYIQYIFLLKANFKGIQASKWRIIADFFSLLKLCLVIVG